MPSLTIDKNCFMLLFFTLLNAILADVVEARVSGGTIFRFAGEAGVAQGSTVGANDKSTAF